MRANVSNMLCSFADSVVVSGASYFIWGEKEIPNRLKEKYENIQENNKNEEE